MANHYSDDESTQSLTKFVLNPALFNPEFYASILRLWLPTYPEPSSQFTQADLVRWFAPSETTDKEVRTLAFDAISSISPDAVTLPPFTSLEADRELYEEIAAPFISHLRSSVSGTVDAIPVDTHSALALSILLDQFPRNIFRGSVQAIVYNHYDRISRAVSSQIRSLGLDRAESLANAPVWRLWFYMPLEHCESMSDHELFRAILEQMLEKSKSVEDETGMKFVKGAMGFEEKHWQPLREFGRFPWRNKWLGRESTAAEKRWLEERDDEFGTG